MTEAVINKHAKELINDIEIPKKEGKRRKTKEKDKQRKVILSICINSNIKSKGQT